MATLRNELCFVDSSTVTPRLFISSLLFGLGLLWNLALPLLAQADSLSLELQAGNALRDSFDYAGAIEHYRRVVDRNPNDAEALLQLSLAYLQTASFDRSLDVALQGARLQSDRLPQFNALVGLNYNYAIIISEYYENLVTRHDSEIVAFRIFNRTQATGASKIFGLGLTYWSMGRSPIAEECLQESAALDSTFSDPLFILGLLWIERGEYPKAQAALEQFFRLDPDSFLAEQARLLVERIRRKEQR
ncbi:MAG: Tetratricopeptide repeat protein [Chlorobi bacterium OLB7]|nr:MAG: Tetratricopeptide repeat protein [Chlorobi bacterium OLB7]